MTAELSLEDLNGRFKYLNPPFPLPGKCAVCGNVRTPVVDFGATVDHYGALLICERCIIQAFSLLTKIGVVEVPQSVPAETYQAIKDELKDNVDAAILSLTSLLSGFGDLDRNLAEELAQRESESDSGSGKGTSETASGTDGQIGDDAGDERSLGLPSGGSFKSGISGL